MSCPCSAACGTSRTVCVPVPGTLATRWAPLPAPLWIDSGPRIPAPAPLSPSAAPAGSSSAPSTSAPRLSTPRAPASPSLPPGPSPSENQGSRRGQAVGRTRTASSSRSSPAGFAAWRLPQGQGPAGRSRLPLPGQRCPLGQTRVCHDRDSWSSSGSSCSPRDRLRRRQPRRAQAGGLLSGLMPAARSTANGLGGRRVPFLAAAGARHPHASGRASRACSSTLSLCCRRGHILESRRSVKRESAPATSWPSTPSSSLPRRRHPACPRRTQSRCRSSCVPLASGPPSFLLGTRPWTVLSIRRARWRLRGPAHRPPSALWLGTRWSLTSPVLGRLISACSWSSS